MKNRTMIVLTTVLTLIVIISVLAVSVAFAQNKKQEDLNYTDIVRTSVASILFNEEHKYGLWEDGELFSEIASSCLDKIHLDELQTYDFFELAFSLPPKKLPNGITPYSNMSRPLMYVLEDYCELFPVQSIKKIDDNCIVVTYKLQDDESNIYAYFVFENKPMFFDESEGIEKSGNYEHWTSKGEYYFAEESFYVNDGKMFDEIMKLKAGDSVPDYLLDTIQMNPLCKRGSATDENGVSYMNFDYLTEDGVIVVGVTYDDSDNSEETKNEIYDVTFYPYGTDDEQAKDVYKILRNNVVELPQ